jgi:hyperosmotically inducible protein
MNIKLTVLGIGAALAIGGCTSTTPGTNANANRAGGNANTAVVMNSNQAPVMNTNMGTMNSNMTSSTNSNFNYNMTREEVNANRSNVEAEARRAGGSVGQGASDAWIWTKTRAALTTAADLRDSTINVDVSNGAITLKGTVANQQQKASAAKIAQGIEGKTSVVNQLTVNANDSMMNTNMTGGNANTGAGKRP